MTKKSPILIVILFCLVGIPFKTLAQVFDSNNISFLSRWDSLPIPQEPQFGARYNSCYGYHDPQTNREYAIIGSTEGTHIIDITNPSSPVEVDFVAGRRNQCIWREYKTYQHYLYAVSDDAPPNSLQIIDLAYLPDSVHVVHDADSIFQKSHTIYIDGNKLYCGVLTRTFDYHAMAVYSLNNPVNPQYLADLDAFPQFYQVHDMFVRNDTVYASCGFEKLQVFKFDSITNTFTQLGGLTTYPEAGYNHSSVLTADGKHLIFADEVPAGLGMKIADVSDLSDIQISSVFRSNNGATPHNPYLVGNKAVIAYYNDGLQIFDVSDPVNPVRTGYFDTHPQNGAAYQGQTYAGAWGAYPYLPSGNILVSDMQYGLFVLNANAALGIPNGRKSDDLPTVQLFPNPASGRAILQGLDHEPSAIDIFSSNGIKVLSPSISAYIDHSVNIDLSQLSPGMYHIRICYPDGKFESIRILH